MKHFIKPLTFAAALILPRGAMAQEPAGEKYPLFAPERVSIAAGANYEWRTLPFGSAGDAITGRPREWSSGVYGAYSLTPHLTLVASTVLGLESRQFRHAVGLRVRLWTGLKQDEPK